MVEEKKIRFASIKLLLEKKLFVCENSRSEKVLFFFKKCRWIVVSGNCLIGLGSIGFSFGRRKSETNALFALFLLSQIDATHDGVSGKYLLIFGGINAICVLTGGYFDSWIWSWSQQQHNKHKHAHTHTSRPSDIHWRDFFCLCVNRPLEVVTVRNSVDNTNSMPNQSASGKIEWEASNTFSIINTKVNQAERNLNKSNRFRCMSSFDQVIIGCSLLILREMYLKWKSESD